MCLLPNTLFQAGLFLAAAGAIHLTTVIGESPPASAPSLPVALLSTKGFDLERAVLIDRHVYMPSWCEL